MLRIKFNPHAPVTIKPADSKHDLAIKLTEKMKSGRAKIGGFQKMRIKNLMGVSEVRFKKTRLLHLENVKKPPNPQFSVQREPEGKVIFEKF